MKISGRWIKDEEFETRQDHHSILTDGNRRVGFSPKALLLAGLAACSGIDVVEILHKMRVEFSHLDIDVETSQTDEHPRVFKDIYIVFKIKTAAQNLDKVKKAIDLSLEKYCGVSAMLKKNSPIHYNIQIES
jgi:putative redox protein